MKKMFIFLALVSLLSLEFVVNIHAMGSMAKSGVTTYETFDLRGTQVKSPEGEGLGSISDFVIDSKGRVILVVLYCNGSLGYDDGKYVAVPFSALSISEVKPHEMNVVINMDKWKMESAPSFDMATDLNDTEGAIDIYRYFGQQPYWMEKESAKGEYPRTGGRRPLRNSMDSISAVGVNPLAVFFLIFSSSSKVMNERLPTQVFMVLFSLVCLKGLGCGIIF